MPKKSTIKFNVDDLLPEQINEYDAAVARQDVDALAEIFARCCTELPEGWGATFEPATFAGMDYNPEFVMVMNAMSDAINTAKERYKEKKVHGVTFSFRGVKATEFAAMSKRINTGDAVKQAEVLVECVTACPPDWGNPQEAATYLKLSYYKMFLPLVRQLISEANTLKKR